MHKKRDYDIDFLRFIAAISVLLFHYTFRGFQADNMTSVSFHEISFLTQYGYLGVNLFFLISGYVILMSAYNQRLKTFLISRFTRLYPTFWLAVVVTTVSVFILSSFNQLPTIDQFVLNLTMVPTLFGENNIDGVYWTLLIELKFYLLIALLLVFKQIKHVKYYALIWVLWSIYYFYTSFPYRLHDFLFPSFSSYFIAGAMFYLLRIEGISLFKILILLLSYVSSLLYEFRHLERQINYFSTDYSLFIVVAMITLVYLVFFVISRQQKTFFQSELVLYLGGLTYALYLLHQNIGYYLLDAFSQYLNWYMSLLVIIVVMLLISLIVHLWVEKKFSNYIKKRLLDTLVVYSINKEVNND